VTYAGPTKGSDPQVIASTTAIIIIRCWQSADTNLAVAATDDLRLELKASLDALYHSYDA